MLRNLELTNFRSYERANFMLGPNATVVVGPNASGKTNLLEALHVLGTTGSFRARHWQLINHTASDRVYRVVATMGEDTLGFAYQESDSGATKRATRNGVASTLVDHVGRINVVLFEPNDLLLIFGGPDRRRRFLDGVLSQTSRPYLKTLHAYKRALAQRNRLLSDWNGDDGGLFAWNVQLADLASDIYTHRHRFLQHINELASERYASIAGGAQELILSYEGTVAAQDPTQYSSTYLGALDAAKARDIGAGFTTVGPHRDDVSIHFRGGPISSRASRGEMRTVVLVLKLAELDYVERQTGSSPLLLLDDVFSELDADRRRLLIATLSGRQSVITTTDADHVTGELGSDVTLIHTEEAAGAK